METIKDDGVVLNLKLLKRTRFYHLFNPNSKKICNWNVYLITIVSITAVSQVVPILAIIGFSVKGLDSLSYIEHFLIAFPILLNNLVSFMLIRISNKSNTIWDLFPVTKFNFLTSPLCTQNIETLNKYREKTIWITNFLVNFTVIASIQWALNPFVLNSFMRIETANGQMYNVLNFPYPVKTDTYNQYYIVFYILEVFLLLMIIYILLVFDGVLISFYFAIIGQFNVITRSFKNVGWEDKTQIEDYLNFKSIICDQQKLNLKLKSFYLVFRPVILVFIAFNFVLMVVITYSLIMVCLSMKSFSIFDVIKLVTTVFVQYYHLFLYCSMFDNLDTEVNSVNFSMYSCNWTKMDIKFKKFLRLAMQMNNANCSVIRFSPKKIVNLQLFGSVVTTSYNIISVMVNSVIKTQ